MQDAAIVPESDGAGRPSKAAGKPFIACVVEQEFKQRGALLLSHVFESYRKRSIDEQRLAPGFGVSPYDRVLHLVKRLVARLNLHILPVRL